MDKIEGTKDWSDKSLNIQIGCENDCVYCYAKSIMVRFNKVFAEDWCHPKFKDLVNDPTINKYARKKQDGVIMFPTAHDITTNNINEVLEVLRLILVMGNKVLIVSKADPACIEEITSIYSWANMRGSDQLEFRFTIGSAKNETLKLWEPNAPKLMERMLALKFAADRGFRVSVSCEPLLDPDLKQLFQLFEGCKFKGDIWLGKMNMPFSRIRMNTKRTFPEGNIIKLMGTQTDAAVINMIKWAYDSPLGNQVKLKDSFARIWERYQAEKK